MKIKYVKHVFQIKKQFFFFQFQEELQTVFK